VIYLALSGYPLQSETNCVLQLPISVTAIKRIALVARMLCSAERCCCACSCYQRSSHNVAGITENF